MSDITVGFGADTSDFEKGKQKVIGGFKEVGDAAKKTQPALDKIGAGKATKGLGGLADTTRQARFAMTNLNRVVSDAPFGFIAIQNNIDQAAFSLMNLIRTTGGAKAAMKALAASFTGFGGIVTVITLASALYLAFGDTIKEAFSKGSKAAAEYKEALNEAIEATFKLEEVKLGKDALFDRATAIDSINSKLQQQFDIRKDIQELESKATTEGSSIGGTSPLDIEVITEEEKKLLAVRRDNLAELQDEIVALSTQITQYDTLFRSKTRALADGAKTPPKEENEKFSQPFAKIKIPGDKDVLARYGAYKELFDAIKEGYARAVDPFDDPLPPLPKMETTEATNAFDDYAETLVKTQRLAASGIIDSQESMQRELAFTQELLERASNEGFPLAAEAVEIYKLRVEELAVALGMANEKQKETEEAQRKVNESLDTAVATIDVFGSEAIEALADIAVGLEKIEDIGRIVGDVIKHLARDLIIAAAKAALLKVLFPGSAGAAGGFAGLFKGFLGLTGISAQAPSLAAPRVTDTLSFGTSGLGSAASTIQLQATSIGINGDQLKILVEQADRRSIRQRGY